jgi:hypothetical protein
MNTYSLRARTSKSKAKNVSAAASISDQETSDQNDPIPVSRHLFSDVVSGNKTLKLRGGHDNANDISEEENNFQDLGTTKRSDDQDDQTPDQNPNRWTKDNPNMIRLCRSLNSLSKSDGIKNLKVDKHSNQRAEAHAMDLGPSNWGDKDLDDEELDLEAQQTALDLLKHEFLRKKAVSAESTAAARVRKTVIREPRTIREGTASQTPVPRRDQISPKTRNMNSRPISQIPLDSYLGQTLNNIKRLGTSKRRSKHDPSSSSSSSSSSDSSTSEKNSEPEIDNSDEDPLDRTLRKRRSRSKGKKKSKRPRKSGLKPIVPKEYDGSADARVYNRFVTEGTTYVYDGRVPRNRRVFVLSYYLDGVAYDFYTQKVSMNFANWTLQEFFEELYNYCFPVNYRMEQRLTLKRCFQNDKKVSAYVHELEELYNMIGAVDEREKVIKLWYGLQTSIQQGLWRDRLNPETSTWEEVVDHASILEIAHSISEPKDDDSDADNSATEYDAEYNSTAEYSSSVEYDDTDEYISDAENAPNPPGVTNWGNFIERIEDSSIVNLDLKSLPEFPQTNLNP